MVFLKKALYFYIIVLLQTKSVNAKEEIIGEIGRMKTHILSKNQTFVGATKVVVRGKFVIFNAYFRKEERSHQ